MKIYHHSIEVFTSKVNQLKDITAEVQSFVSATNIKVGQIYLFVPHTTAAVTINENTDPSVKKDFILGLSQAFPKDQAFLHFEGNSHAHIKSSVVGNTQVVLIKDGRLKLGKWQAIYFCEFDGPRKRQLDLQVIGE